MTKGLISIFALPSEIDNLHLTLYNLRRNAEFITDDVSYSFNITLNVGDQLTNWEQSSLPKEYFVEKFLSISTTLCSWAPDSNFNVDDGTDIMGCVSQRRHTLQYVDDYDFTLWMDNDLFFNDTFLAYLSNAAEALKEHPYYIITPQITRQWDSSWDVLVNETLLDRPFNDNLTANVFKLGMYEGEIKLKQIPTFKAAGGWGTTISNKLLKVVGIPESLGHYGLEDTYVLTCAQMLQQSGTLPVAQIVLDGLLVCENHSGQTNDYLKKMIHSIDRKDEFRQIATQNFQQELERFYNENILQNK